MMSLNERMEAPAIEIKPPNETLKETRKKLIYVAHKIAAEVAHLLILMNGGLSNADKCHRKAECIGRCGLAWIAGAMDDDMYYFLIGLLHKEVTADEECAFLERYAPADKAG